MKRLNLFTSFIGLGLSLVVILVLALVFLAHQLTEHSLNASSQVVQHQQQKLHHLMNMHIAGQSRTINLQQMILLDDPFDQDQVLVQFYQNASDYMTHRDQIGALINQSENEQARFNELYQMAEVTSPLQTQVAELALNQQKASATELLNQKGMEQLKAFTQSIQDFSAYQFLIAQEAVDKFRTELDQLMRTVLGVATALILISLVIATFILHRFSLINQALRRANDQLEDRVKSRTQALTLAQNELIEKNSHLEKLSSTDSLTGLYNRFKMDQFLTTAHQRFIQHGESYQIMFVDIDHFKPINDDFGHQVGDQVLQQFSQLLLDKFSSNSLIGRWGGEEFILVFAGHEIGQACDEAERIRQSIEQTEFHPEFKVTVSIGVARVEFKDQVKDVINRADMALYKAKSTGRNRVERCRFD